jgi:hypothetical protein
MPAAPITAASDNLFAVLLGTVSAPAGWTVRPCEGDGPFLCVLKGQEDVGAVHLSIYPIETMTDFERMLTTAGGQIGPLDLTDPQQRDRLMIALESFVAAYHTAIESDRQVEYGGQIRYVRIENEVVMMGALPGLRFGFAGEAEDEAVFERYISFVAYDGDLMYILVAAYRPGSIPTFRSDEELTEFLPHLTQIVAGLRLPLPVLQTDVTSVRALRSLDIFRSYGAEAGNPVGQVAADQTVPVTGISPTGRHWRIDCPDPAMRGCWIAGTAGATEPAAR